MKSIPSLGAALLVLTLVIAACNNQPNGSGVSTGATPALKSAGEAVVASTREALTGAGAGAASPAPSASPIPGVPSPSPVASPQEVREPGPAPSVVVVPTP